MLITATRHAIAQAAGEGDEVLAIGDIHGEAGLFDALLAHAASLPPQGRRVLVLTGDLIDRGPASLAVLAMAAEARVRVGAAETVALMGNHEQVLRCALDGVRHRRLAAYTLWIANGGDAVLREALGPTWERCHGPKRLREALDGPLAFLRTLRSHWRSGDLLFVHAGLSPTIAPDTFLAAPWDVDFRTLDESAHWGWVRGPFLQAESHGGLFVVHGHTPHDNADRTGPAAVSRARLNLDLGSGSTGRARMARFVGDEVTIFDAIDG